LPALFAELMALHYDPQYERSQARHFRGWTQRQSIACTDLSDAGIGRLAEQVRALPAVAVQEKTAAL